MTGTDAPIISLNETTNRLTFLARSPASGKCSPTWHWNNECKSVSCRHIGIYRESQIPDTDMAGLDRIGSFTFSFYTCHLRGKSDTDTAELGGIGEIFTS